mgnify:CR=1 FL=1
MSVPSPNRICLKRSNYNEKFKYSLVQFYNSDTLTDATISCDGNKVKVHRLVLSIFSNFFKETFESFTSPSQYPVVVIENIPWIDLKTIIDFIYTGEIIISESQLDSLLKSAKDLQIEGLRRDELNQSLDDLQHRNQSTPSKPQAQSYQICLRNSNQFLSPSETAVQIQGNQIQNKESKVEFLSMQDEEKVSSIQSNLAQVDIANQLSQIEKPIQNVESQRNFSKIPQAQQQKRQNPCSLLSKNLQANKQLATENNTQAINHPSSLASQSAIASTSNATSTADRLQEVIKKLNNNFKDPKLQAAKLASFHKLYEMQIDKEKQRKALLNVELPSDAIRLFNCEKSNKDKLKNPVTTSTSSIATANSVATTATSTILRCSTATSTLNTRTTLTDSISTAPKTATMTKTSIPTIATTTLATSRTSPSSITTTTTMQSSSMATLNQTTTLTTSEAVICRTNFGTNLNERKDKNDLVSSKSNQTQTIEQFAKFALNALGSKRTHDAEEQRVSGKRNCIKTGTNLNDNKDEQIPKVMNDENNCPNEKQIAAFNKIYKQISCSTPISKSTNQAEPVEEIWIDDEDEISRIEGNLAKRVNCTLADAQMSFITQKETHVPIVPSLADQIMSLEPNVVKPKPKVQHKVKKLQCHLCQKSFVNTFSLNQHIGLVHVPAGRIVCQFCNTVFANAYLLSIHINDNHQEHLK